MSSAQNLLILVIRIVNNRIGEEFKMIASFDIGEKNFAYSIGTADVLVEVHHINVIKKPRQTIIESCGEITKILAAQDFSLCERVIIEQQMRANIRAQRLAQHVWSWFSILKPDLNPIFVPSSLKTQYYLGKNSLNSKQRKNWAITKFIDILTSRLDTVHLGYVNSLAKKDDVADTYLQLVAYAKTRLPWK